MFDSLSLCLFALSNTHGTLLGFVVFCNILAAWQVAFLPILLCYAWSAHSIFRFEEFAQFMQAQGTDRVAGWRQQLSYHRKVGNLVHIRKYLYAVKLTSIAAEEFWIDPYLIAGKAAPDAAHI